MLRKKKNLKVSKITNSNTITKTSFKKIAYLSILTFCLIIIAVILLINSYLNKIDKIDLTKNDLNLEDTFSKQEDITTSSDNIKNIALFGIDETEGTAGRSDCIMILTVDNKHSELKLSSIIRDSYVTIPTKNNKDKINHAYAFGGPKLALQTLNTNFKLNLDKFISVNFSSLPKVIDSVGGISLGITDDELKYINYYITDLNERNGSNSPLITASGEQRVDGTQALAYCRIRYTDGGDFERSHRHRTVLTKVFEKFETIPMTKYPSLLDEVLPIIHTNLEKTELLSLGLNLNSLKNNVVLQDRFPYDEDGDGKLIDGIYYYVFDNESTTNKMYKFIFES